jgi:hypothetical protein
MSAKAMSDVRRIKRWCAAAGAVAALGVGLLAVPATPAWAADPLELKAENNVQGKVGDKVQVRFTIKNNTKQPANNITVGVQTPANAVMEAGDNPGCNIGGGGRTASCKANGALAPDKTANGAIVMTVKTAGQAAGRIGVQGGNTENFGLRATGGPSPSVSASKTSAKPTKTSSLSASGEPTIDANATFAPPAADNGVALAPTSEPAANKTGNTGGGMGLGLWVGIIAIVGALGLIGSLFYFRRKDRNEPDTGMHPVVPAPAGFPGYNPPPAQPATYGSPQPATYGNPAAATQMIDPNFGGSPPGGSNPTQVFRPVAGPNAGPDAPPGSDATVTFRRPDEY